MNPSLLNYIPGCYLNDTLIAFAAAYDAVWTDLLKALDELPASTAFPDTAVAIDQWLEDFSNPLQTMLPAIPDTRLRALGAKLIWWYNRRGQLSTIKTIAELVMPGVTVTPASTLATCWKLAGSVPYPASVSEVRGTPADVLSWPQSPVFRVNEYGAGWTLAAPGVARTNSIANSSLTAPVYGLGLMPSGWGRYGGDSQVAESVPTGGPSGGACARLRHTTGTWDWQGIVTAAGNGSATLQVAVRVPTGVQPSALLASGTGVGAVVVASDAQLAAQPRDTWVWYAIPFPVSESALALFVSSDRVGAGVDVALPTVGGPGLPIVTAGAVGTATDVTSYNPATGVALLGAAAPNLSADGQPCSGSGTSWQVPATVTTFPEQVLDPARWSYSAGSLALQRWPESVAPVLDDGTILSGAEHANLLASPHNWPEGSGLTVSTSGNRVSLTETATTGWHYRKASLDTAAAGVTIALTLYPKVRTKWSIGINTRSGGTKMAYLSLTGAGSASVSSGVLYSLTQRPDGGWRVVLSTLLEAGATAPSVELVGRDASDNGSYAGDTSCGVDVAEWTAEPVAAPTLSLTGRIIATTATPLTQRDYTWTRSTGQLVLTQGHAGNVRNGVSGPYFQRANDTTFQLPAEFPKPGTLVFADGIESSGQWGGDPSNWRITTQPRSRLGVSTRLLGAMGFYSIRITVSRVLTPDERKLLALITQFTIPANTYYLVMEPTH